ncbi:MAG: polyprenyl synthetase family protein [Chloroflexi bacterium]|nr:polyprenyl synthetase family protein [Chloroflexota bacterium]
MSAAHEVTPSLDAYVPEVESALRKHVEQASAGGLPLYRMMQYQLGWVDRDGIGMPPAPSDRTYGALCLLAANSVADAAPYFGNAATAIELFHESVAVHEQMQAGDAGRDDHPPVWWLWGPAQAINVGDGLHALGRLALLRSQALGLAADDAIGSMAVLDDLALRYYEGQYIDLTYQERVDITTAQYSTMARSKAGALLGGSIALGARVAGCDDETVGRFQEIGALVGEAAQIRSDIEAIWGGGAPEGRVLNKSKLFPVVHVLEHGALADKRALGGVYFKRVMEAADVEEIRRVLDKSDARAQSEQRRAELVTEAQQTVAKLPLATEQLDRWQEVVSALS